MEVTRQISLKTNPPSDIVSITARTSLCEGGFRGKSSLSLGVSRAGRGCARVRQNPTTTTTMDPAISRGKSNGMGKINGGATAVVRRVLPLGSNFKRGSFFKVPGTVD